MLVDFMLFHEPKNKKILKTNLKKLTTSFPDIEVSFYIRFCKKPKFHRSPMQNTFCLSCTHKKSPNGLKKTMVESLHFPACLPAKRWLPWQFWWATFSQNQSGTTPSGSWPVVDRFLELCCSLQHSKHMRNGLPMRQTSQSVCKSHAAMVAISSCMGSTFRSPRPKGAPFV